MRFLEYEQILVDSETKHEVDSMIYKNGFYGELAPWVIQLYEHYDPLMSQDVERVIALKLSRQLSTVISALDGNVSGTRIVDLGSGSTGVVEDSLFSSAPYQPWLCRALYALGARPVAVDYGSFEHEPFETRTANLLDSDSLSFIELDESIDLVHAYQLFNSPQLELLTSGQGWGHGSMATGENLARVLRPQIERILKPDGKCVYYTDLNQYGKEAKLPRRRSWPF